MIVTLLTNENILNSMCDNARDACLICRGNLGTTEDTQKVLQNIIHLGHESILEHINLIYCVRNLSRACLQELARHRHISLSVESTRHTLNKKLDNYDELYKNLMSVYQGFSYELAKKAVDALIGLDLKNDTLKYLVPELFLTNLFITANVRELRHIINLRTAPQALKEFQTLARGFYEVIPDKFKYLFAGCIHGE